ncbi:MAG TPA: FG-GAP-like repeat-containing protein, partial [candidate division Zixibacteria bacterium]
SSPNNVSILMNNGDATFADAVNYETGEIPSISIFCADLDGDDDLDLTVANSGVFEGNISILKNNGDGTFADAVNYGAGSYPTSVFCADLDGDGDLDLAVANDEDNNVSILKNNGDGTFANAVNYGAGSYPTSVFCADLDTDGDLDLAVANGLSNNVSILMNLTQLPANQPPWAFSLLSPENGATTPGSATFRWRIPYDPNFGDKLRYDLYLSTTPGFENPTIIENLPVSTHEIAFEDGDYYWKVKARDNWGAETWSTETRFVQVHYMTDGMGIIAFSPVDLIVTDPMGDSISLWFNTIPNATYDTTTDYNQDGDNDDIVTIPDRLVGEYQIEVVAEPGGSGTYELGIRIDGGAPAMLTMPGGNPCPGEDEVDTFYYSAPWYKTGDANGDWVVDVGDVVYLINYLYKGGVSPEPVASGDATCEGFVDVGDVVYLINYLFKGGPPPSC